MKTRSIVITGVVLVLAALVLVTLTPLLFPATFGGSAYGGMMGPGMMGGYGMMGGFMALGMVLTALFWFGVMLLIVWGVTQLFPTWPSTGRPDALEILKQRYARGEISREEFVQASEALR